MPFSFQLQTDKLDTNAILGLIALAIFGGAIWASQDWDFRSFLFPRAIGTVGIAFTLIMLTFHLFLSPQYIQALKGISPRDRVQAERAAQTGGGSGGGEARGFDRRPPSGPGDRLRAIWTREPSGPGRWPISSGASAISPLPRSSA